jgi:cytidylate kinase
VASVVSSVAALGRVRDRMVAAQREIAREGPVVMAGRDIGTVVLPEARFKFFLTASVDERAKRRHTEFAERGVMLPFDEVREQIAERDRIDMTRAVAPLRAAADAVLIDSTTIPSDEVVERMRAVVEAAG